MDQSSAVLLEAATGLVDAALSGNYLADAVLEQIAQLSEGMVKRRLLKHPLFDLIARTPGDRALRICKSFSPKRQTPPGIIRALIGARSFRQMASLAHS